MVHHSSTLTQLIYAQIQKKYIKMFVFMAKTILTSVSCLTKVEGEMMVKFLLAHAIC